MTNKHVSVYGSTGFIGSNWMSRSPVESTSVLREENAPNACSTDALYFISTTDNYNVFDNPHLDIDTNLNKLVSVLESCRENNKDIVFNFVSSWFVYGLNASLNTKEEDYCQPTGFYSITKRAAEQMLISYCETYDMKYRIFRLTNIIGDGDRRVSRKKNYLQHMIGMLRNNEDILLYDKGSNIRDYMHVYDACKAIGTCVLQAPVNDIINISNNNKNTMGELTNYCKSKVGSSSSIGYIETPHFHSVVQVKDVSLNNEKLVSFGYNDKGSAFDALNLILEKEVVV